MSTTRALLDRVKADTSLRRICGWERVSDIPEEWTFSRAFSGFSKSQLPERVHKSFIKDHYKNEIVGHNSRDSTAINAREKPLKKEKVKQPPKKRGRPKKRRNTDKRTHSDSAYDVSQIHEVSQQLGHIPLIDKHPRRDRALKAELKTENKRCRVVGYQSAETIRYKERSTVERVNGRLKDEFGGRVVRVRGHAKVMCHLMFGILALTSNQMMCFLE